MNKQILPNQKNYTCLFFLFITICLASIACNDSVQLTNNSTSENGLLVDGRDGTGNFNDKKFISAAATIDVVSIDASAASNEVIAFTNHRPPAIVQNVPWTSSFEQIAVPYANKMKLAVKVWILHGPFNTTKTTAINACITTSNIWNSERMGLDFSTFEIIDATGDAQAATYLDFTCTQQAGIKTDIGFTAGRINIYYVRTVDGGADRGQACQIGSDFVAMASGSGSELMSHELGHCFSLQHVDGDSNFDQTNIMHPASNTRQFVTEGQLFRAHLRTNSAINFVYAARPALPTRDCAHSNLSSDACPAIQKRIWADGTFPAN